MRDSKFYIPTKLQTFPPPDSNHPRHNQKKFS